MSMSICKHFSIQKKIFQDVSTWFRPKKIGAGRLQQVLKLNQQTELHKWCTIQIHPHGNEPKHWKVHHWKRLVSPVSRLYRFFVVFPLPCDGLPEGNPITNRGKYMLYRLYRYRVIEKHVYLNAYSIMRLCFPLIFPLSRHLFLPSL